MGKQFNLIERRKIVATVEAIQWTGDNFAELEAFAGMNVAKLDSGTLCVLYFGDEWSTVEIGAWVLKENGEFSSETEKSFAKWFVPIAMRAEGGAP
jgi:hypothetical protein